MHSDLAPTNGHWRDGSNGADLNDRFIIDNPDSVEVVEAHPLDDPTYCPTDWLENRDNAPLWWLSRYSAALAAYDAR